MCVYLIVRLSVCLSVCLFVCPLACLKNHMSKFHQIFYACYLWLWFDLPRKTLQLCYVLPVFWMTSCFHLMEPMDQRRYVLSSSPGGGTGCELLSMISALFVVYTTRKCDNLQLNTAHSKQNIRLKYNLTKYVYKEISIEQGIWTRSVLLLYLQPIATVRWHVDLLLHNSFVETCEIVVVMITIIILTK